MTGWGQTTSTSTNHFTFARKQAFFKAVKGGDVARVMEMVEADREWVSVRDEKDHGVIGLHVAKTVEVAKCLLDHGADIEALDLAHLGTPLQWAVASGKKATVKALLSAGAKVSPGMIQNAADSAAGRIKGISNEKPEVFREIIEMLKHPPSVEK